MSEKLDNHDDPPPAKTILVSDSSHCLSVTEYRADLKVRNGGDCLPWVGPALRGVVARSLKQSVCIHSIEEQESTWRYCHGCVVQSTCHYSRLFEPTFTLGRAHLESIVDEPKIDLQNEANSVAPRVQSRSLGFDEATRLFVMAPDFLGTDRMSVNDSLGVRFVFVEDTQSCWPTFWERFIDSIRDRGIGPNRIRLEPRGAPVEAHSILNATGFMNHFEDGVVTELDLQLLSPLCLRQRVGEQRITSLNPTLGDLLSCSYRIVMSIALQRFGQSLQSWMPRSGMDLGSLLSLGDALQVSRIRPQKFQQKKWSNRTEQRFEVQGITGRLRYQNVPWTWLPWLYWGGKLHVGLHRVAGAGGWRLHLN